MKIERKSLFQTRISMTALALALTLAVGLPAMAFNSHGCARPRANGGRVTAWGHNANGQTNPPADLTNVVAVSAGETYTVALRADGTVVAWGDDTFGQLGVPSGLTNVVAVAAGA